MTTTTHIDRTQTYPCCYINGWQQWSTELNWLTQRLWNLSLNQFDIFDCREYDSLKEAREVLIELYRTGQYVPAEKIVEPVHALINIDTGEQVRSTIQQLAHRFGYRRTYTIRRLLDSNTQTRGKLARWRIHQR